MTKTTAAHFAVFILLAGSSALAAPVASSAPRFRDATSASGLDFVQSNGITAGKKNYFEVMGSGACLLDANGDGRLDVYLVTSVGESKLFENLGGLRFRDATKKSGLASGPYAMGAVAADIDNDGDPDLLVTADGPERLYLNTGGVFRDATRTSGVGDSLWSCGAAFLDADRDGRLDLYVVNYVHVAHPDTAKCLAEGGRIAMYCPPRRYPRAESVYYRNLGGGRFTNATKAAGLAGFAARGLGVVSTDYDRDGWPDLYVANDLDANWLFRNRHDGTFEEVGLVVGVARSESGKALSGMGVAAGDPDNDGWMDLFVTNYVNEPNTLFHNEGNGFFQDVTTTSGLGPASLPDVGWGTEFLDYDLDGWDDLLVVNGHTESDAERVDPTTTYKQPGRLFRNRGNGKFEETTSKDAPSLLTPRAGRGAAFGDLDDDGDTDVVIVNQNDRAVLLENAGGTRHHWIGVRAVGVKSNKDAIGARIEVYAGPLLRTREVRAGSSYLSGCDVRALVGLGTRASVDSVVVTWPSGVRESHRGLVVDRYHRLVEGKP